jgi:threonine aldolase
MAEAVVGDDGYGEDPTVIELERQFARRVGKPAAVFVPSGVMANQIALRCLTSPGDVVLTGRRNHVALYELGAAGRNAGVQLLGLDDSSGILDPASIAEAIEGAAHHQPAIAAIFLESPHMASGGGITDPASLEQIVAAAGGRPIHLDGARLFNAEVATGISAERLAEGSTTVMACLSKGLSAPVGSVLAGPPDVIDLARIERKRLGGSMRQAGVLAACGLVALAEMIERLAEDHRRARDLAGAVAERWPDSASTLESQTTNLVVFPHPDADGLIDHLALDGILAGTIAPGVVRFVTHRGVDDEDVAMVVESLRRAP